MQGKLNAQIKWIDICTNSDMIAFTGKTVNINSPYSLMTGGGGGGGGGGGVAGRSGVGDGGGTGNKTKSTLAYRC